MYFAKNSENQSLNLYLLLLNKYLEEGQEDYKPLLEDIVVNAHKLAVDEISHYDVKNSIYDIVNLFVTTNKDYFARNIDPSKIDRSVFVNMQTIMRSLASGNLTPHT